MSDLKQQIEKRRTFAIISHPDAGKTTLTEKLLLYGGAINLAGSVKGKKTAKHAVSDIPSVWTGKAANAFVAKGKQLRTEILKEASSLEETARVIRSIAKRTYDTEMRALELAEMRAYS